MDEGHDGERAVALGQVQLADLRRLGTVGDGADPAGAVFGVVVAHAAFGADEAADRGEEGRDRGPVPALGLRLVPRGVVGPLDEVQPRPLVEADQTGGEEATPVLAERRHHARPGGQHRRGVLRCHGEGGQLDDRHRQLLVLGRLVQIHDSHKS
ncbi:Uncharacterised protein [Amycolatopsis camponoti]|uniref:Uncharacterized protein n=1 Tax=Amycolatopsis camponoti TaxID=2606593 RepID=A0A6I8LVL6_9PSEU|nr:Uncharacterised protein [Amycolatopsis camponoti]